MKKALVVGIDYYEHCAPLFGCVNDAHAVKSVLDRHGNGTVNFGVKILTGTGPTDKVNRVDVRQSIKELFETDCDTALFFFAGHGCIDSAGGYLITSDSETGDDGISVNDILTFANKSNAKNRVIVLDSCHSGIAGDRSGNAGAAELRDGTTILTASTADQYASETDASGVFTTLFVDALNGAAANLVGHITPGSVYAHIDQSLGPWEQRPVFKTNVKSFVTLREVEAPIPLTDLHQITKFFPVPGHEFRLDPSYEPESPNPDVLNTSIFRILQKFNRVNLLIPVGAPHMFHAAMESKSCKLTVLGEHYRRLVEKGRI